MVVICGVFCSDVSGVYYQSVWFVKARAQTPFGAAVEVGLTGSWVLPR